MKKVHLKLKKNVRNILIIILFSGILIYAFIKVINNYKYKQTNEYKLIQNGYSKDEVQKILEILNEDDINKLANENKNNTILLLIDNKYFKKDNLQRYLNYLKKSGITVEDAISYVNVNKDLKPYENTFSTDTFLNELMLVNKYYLLDENYNPEDLAIVSKKYTWGTTLVKKEVYDAFVNMWEDANKEGIYLMIRYGYISYIDQQTSYENYKKSKTEEKADDTVYRPGASEHQTGYALDILELNHAILKEFNQTDAYNWLIENSYLYGFIPRYPQGKEKINDFDEAYHFRFVGKNAAKIIHDENITFEEYYAYYVK